MWYSTVLATARSVWKKIESTILIHADRILSAGGHIAEYMVIVWLN